MKRIDPIKIITEIGIGVALIATLTRGIQGFTEDMRNAEAKKEQKIRQALSQEWRSLERNGWQGKLDDARDNLKLVEKLAKQGFYSEALSIANGAEEHLKYFFVEMGTELPKDISEPRDSLRKTIKDVKEDLAKKIQEELGQKKV